jgi:opacity protein-like surface antigen
MKRIGLMIAATAGIAFGAAANAAMPASLSPYVSVKAGYGHAALIGEHLSNLNGFGGYGAIGAALKLDINNMDVFIRQEIEGSYARASGKSSRFKDASFAPWSVMGNMYVDLGNCRARPYVGFGLGVSEVNFKWKGGAGSKYAVAHSAFNWGLYAGMNIDLTRSLITDLGLRYTRAELLKRDGDFQMFSATIGLRYQF